MPAPLLKLTPEQRHLAQMKAAEARTAKGEVLKQIRSGELSLADLLSPDAADNERIQRLAVATALRALPGVNPSRVPELLTQLKIDERRRIRGLGVRQREALLNWRGR